MLVGLVAVLRTVLKDTRMNTSNVTMICEQLRRSVAGQRARSTVNHKEWFVRTRTSRRNVTEERDKWNFDGTKLIRANGLTEVMERFEGEKDWSCWLMVVEDVSVVLVSSRFSFVSENQYWCLATATSQDVEATSDWSTNDRKNRKTSFWIADWSTCLLKRERRSDNESRYTQRRRKKGSED